MAPTCVRKAACLMSVVGEHVKHDNSTDEMTLFCIILILLFLQKANSTITDTLRIKILAQL